MKAPNLAVLLDKLRTRKHNYRAAFGPGAPAQKALIDLARFCHAFSNEVVPGDHDRTLILAGCRMAYFRVIDHLQFEPEELLVLYKAARDPKAGDE